MTTFTESDERLALRKAVADLGAKYGRDYFEKAAQEGRKSTELSAKAGAQVESGAVLAVIEGDTE